MQLFELYLFSLFNIIIIIPSIAYIKLTETSIVFIYYGANTPKCGVAEYITALVVLTLNATLLLVKFLILTFAI